MMNSHGLLGPPCSCLVAGLFRDTNTQRHRGGGGSGPGSVRAQRQGQGLPAQEGYLPRGAHQHVTYKGHMQARWIAEGSSGRSRPRAASASRSASTGREETRRAPVVAPPPNSSSPTVPPAPAGSASSIPRPPRRAKASRPPSIQVPNKDRCKERPKDRPKERSTTKAHPKEQRVAGRELKRRQLTRTRTHVTPAASRPRSQVPKRQPTRQSSLTFSKLKKMQGPSPSPGPSSSPAQPKPAAVQPRARPRLRPPLRRPESQQTQPRVASHRVPPTKPASSGNIWQARTKTGLGPKPSASKRESKPHPSRTGGKTAPPLVSSTARIKSRVGIQSTASKTESLNSSKRSRTRLKTSYSNAEPVSSRRKSLVVTNRTSASKSESATNKVRKGTTATPPKAKSALHVNSKTRTKGTASKTENVSAKSKVKSSASRPKVKPSVSRSSVKPARKPRLLKTTSSKSTSKVNLRPRPSASRSRAHRPRGRRSDSSFSMYAPSCSRAKLSRMSLTTQQGSRPRIAPRRKKRRKATSHPAPYQDPVENPSPGAPCKRRVQRGRARQLLRPSSTVMTAASMQGRRAARTHSDTARPSAALVQLEVARSLLRPESIRHMSDRCPAASKRSVPAPAPAPQPSHVANLFTAQWYGSAHPKRRQGLPTPSQQEQPSTSTPAGLPPRPGPSPAPRVIEGVARPRKMPSASDHNERSRRNLHQSCLALSVLQRLSSSPARPRGTESRAPGRGKGPAWGRSGRS